MIQWVCLLLLLNVDDSRIEACRDSLFVYNTYKNQVETLANTTNYQAWRQTEYIDALMTEKAFERLERLNGVPYEPVETLNKEGLGTAYKYPKPTGAVDNYADIDRTDIKFSIMLPQTRFITDINGMTRVPFIIRAYFGTNGEEKYMELLDPYTCEALK
jgi:hypothetical protein